MEILHPMRNFEFEEKRIFFTPTLKKLKLTNGFLQSYFF